MREFALKNNSGKSYELNNLENFLHNPTGLGFVRNPDFLKIGNHYTVSKDNIEQAAPAGQICFKDEKNSSAYEKYAEFIRFTQDTPLTLFYNSDRVHYIDVIIGSIEKTEITRPLGLNVVITFKALTPWYDLVEEEGTNTVKILSDTAIESPCEIQIKGTLTDPVWIQSLNGNQILTGKITGNLAEGEILHIRTDTIPYSLYKTNSGGTKTDLYQNSDFSTNRFVLLKKGLNMISCDGASSIEVKGQLFYESV